MRLAGPGALGWRVGERWRLRALVRTPGCPGPLRPTLPVTPEGTPTGLAQPTAPRSEGPDRSRRPYMSCTYCDAKTLTRVASEHRVCRCCLALTRGGHWDRLANRWLEHRPQDWSSDVA